MLWDVTITSTYRLKVEAPDRDAAEAEARDVLPFAYPSEWEQTITAEPSDPQA